MNKRLPLILAFVIPFVVYLPTLTGTFYYDDNAVFLGHQVTAFASDPFSVFSSDTQYLPGAPRSLHVFFLLLIYKAFGASPLPYHVFNLLMHSATTVLVFLLLRRVLSAGDTPVASGNDTVPLLGSLVFGLHPIHVENITYVTLGGTDVFYMFWALLSLMCYIWFRDRYIKGDKNYLLLAGSVVGFAFALMSKESAVAFVLIYPLTEFILRRRGFLWALPHAALLLIMKRDILFGVAASTFSEAAGGGTLPAQMLKGFGFFAKSLVIPYPHMPYIKELTGAPLLYAFAVAALILLFAGIVSKSRIVTYSVAWFAALSAPYLFAPAIVTNVAITAERYVYAPSVALSLIIGWAIGTGWKREKFRRPIICAAVVVLVAYAALGAAYYYEAWRTEEAFWRYAVKTNPEYVSAYSNLATIEMENGNPEEAKSTLLEGLGKEKGKPEEFAQAAYAMANIYRLEGDRKLAENYYIKALGYADYEFAYMELGFLYLDEGRWDEARTALKGALGYRRNPRVLAGLAFASLRLGEKEQAASYAVEAYENAKGAELKKFAAGLLKEATK